MPKLRSVVMGAILSPFIAATMLGSSAHALSCVAPDLAKTMEEAKASDKMYNILVGRFYHRAAKPPPIDFENQFQSRPPTLTPAFFEGYGLSPNPQTDQPLRAYRVDIETSCAGPWCGSLPQPGTEQIAFVEERPGQPPILRISACPGMMFSAKPQDTRTDMLRTCFDRPCPVKSDNPYR